MQLQPKTGQDAADGRQGKIGKNENGWKSLGDEGGALRVGRQES